MTGPSSIGGWTDSALIQIKELTWLEDDWDAYGATKITQRAIDKAMYLVEEISSLPSPTIAPTPDGGVAFEWRNDNKNLTFEVTGSGQVEIIYDVGDEHPWAGSISESPIDQWAVIQKFFA